MTLTDGPGCGVAHHSDACLCDVIVTTPTPVSVDPMQSCYADIIANALGVSDFSLVGDEDKLRFMSALTKAHDLVEEIDQDRLNVVADEEGLALISERISNYLRNGGSVVRLEDDLEDVDLMDLRIALGSARYRDGDGTRIGMMQTSAVWRMTLADFQDFEAMLDQQPRPTQRKLGEALGVDKDTAARYARFFRGDDFFAKPRHDDGLTPSQRWRAKPENAEKDRAGARARYHLQVVGS